MLKPPIEPMEAEQAEEIPVGNNWQYEPKWDGFRCLIFRRDQEIFLQSKAGQPLGRYFPEIVNAAQDLRPRWWVLDGELAVPAGRAFSFDQLLQRIHPAKSRVTNSDLEIVNAAQDLRPRWWVLDGELAVPVGRAFSFDQLLQRIHPAKSRVTKLAKETPAIYIAFDLLA